MKIRRITTQVEHTKTEMGRPVDTSKAIAMAVIENPYAGVYSDDLSDLIDIGETLGDLLGRAALDALNCDAQAVQSYGKSALIGEDGELEHAAAILHPALGAPLRTVLGGGAALVPSSKAMGAPGTVIDVPLGHINAAYVRSHFDGMRAQINDAPRAGEIVVAVALSTTGRPNPRVGGLTHPDAIGTDGLR